MPVIGGNNWPIPSATSVRQEFVSQLLTIGGDVRALWLPLVSDTTTTTGRDLNAEVWTYDATIAAQLSPLGFGQQVSFNATSDEADTPDSANYTFNDAAGDGFSIVALCNVTDTGASRAILTKYQSAQAIQEWFFYITSADLLRLLLRDDSVPIEPFRTSDAAITMGAFGLLGCTYDGSGGATAPDGITLFQNGLAIASTASYEATYVAMENGTSVLGLGQSDAAANLFSGAMAFVLLTGTELTAAQHFAIKELVNSYYGLAL